MIETVTLQALKAKPQWVCWKMEEREGRRTKVPKSPYGGNAKTNDASTWGTYDECVKARDMHSYDGVGIVFTGRLCGIDIDAVSHDGSVAYINPLEKEVCKLFEGTYMEYSPSGNGIHILGLCEVENLPFLQREGKWRISDDYYMKNPKNNLEIYIAGATNRFFTFTEDKISTDNFRDITREVKVFIDEYMHRNDLRKSNIKGDDMNNNWETKKEEILTAIKASKNGQKFCKLYYDRDISDYGYDESSADLALCDMLAFWCGKDKELMDKMFRDSQLYRAKWERADYREMTLDKACSNVQEIYTAEKADEDEHKKELTLELLGEWLTANGISVRSNEITHELEVEGFDDKYNPLTIVEQMHVIVHDQIKAQYKCNKNLVQDLLGVLADIHRYNPIIEMLAQSKPWDGVDRLPELHTIIGLDPNDEFSKTLIHKWLKQTYSLVFNHYPDGFGADGVLVFQGAQGIGKSTLCRHLGIHSNITKANLYIDSNDKDTLIRATTCWIGELGELETTLRSDMARLKGFLTSEVDRYRVPYGRGDVTYPRRTSFMATCNSAEFLADETGSRRFWVVPCQGRFDLEHLREFDALQLWKQIEFEFKHCGQKHAEWFRLSTDELKSLAERNQKFNRKVKAQSEIEDILADAEVNPNNYEFKWATPTKFRTAFDFLKNYSSENIGRALSAIGLEEKALRMEGSKSVSKGCRYLPFPKSITYTLGDVAEHDLETNYFDGQEEVF